jgi:hypothetical protein
MKTTFLIITLLFHADISSTGQLWTLPFAVVPAALGIPLGLAVVLCGLRNAPEGYEDEDGFHSKQKRPRIRHPLRLSILRPHNAG